MSLQWEVVSKFIRERDIYDDQSVELFKDMLKKTNILITETNNSMTELEDPYILYDSLFDNIIVQKIHMDRLNGQLFLNISFKYEKGYTINISLIQKRGLINELSIDGETIYPSILFQLLLLERFDSPISNILKDYIFTYRLNNGKYMKFSMHELISDVPGATSKNLKKYMRISNRWDDVEKFAYDILSSSAKLNYGKFNSLKPTLKFYVNLCKDVCTRSILREEEDFIRINRIYNHE